MCKNDKVSTYDAHMMIVEDAVSGPSGWRPCFGRYRAEKLVPGLLGVN